MVASFVVVVAALPAPALAQSAGTPAPRIYSCEDEQGRMISSDRPIRDCARREMRVLNRDGSLREVIPPPMTRDQRKQAERDELERMEALARSRARQARDRSLLISFEDEDSLEIMRRRHLAEIDAEIRLATNRILNLDRELKSAQAEAGRQQKDKGDRPLPFAYQRRITDAANAILAEDALIRDRQHERARINERFDADASRLRELLGQPAPPAASRPADDDLRDRGGPRSTSPGGEMEPRADPRADPVHASR